MIRLGGLSGWLWCYEKSRGRTKNYWGEVIRQDTTQLHIFEDVALYRKVWRSSIRVEG